MEGQLRYCWTLLQAESCTELQPSCRLRRDGMAEEGGAKIADELIAIDAIQHVEALQGRPIRWLAVTTPRIGASVIPSQSTPLRGRFKFSNRYAPAERGGSAYFPPRPAATREVRCARAESSTLRSELSSSTTGPRNSPGPIAQ